MKTVRRFTLVEILTAIAIIAILAGISVGVSSFVRNRNCETQTVSTIKLLEMALEQYKNHFGNYPVLGNVPSANVDTPLFRLAVTDESSTDNSQLSKNNLTSCFSNIIYDSAGNSITGIKGLRLGNRNGRMIVLDGWGQPILYLYPGVFNRTKYDLGSIGRDRRLGDGGGEIPSTESFNLGTRTSQTGVYRANFGNGDDITNFKR